MLKKLDAIYRFFVPSKDEVIARRIKNRRQQSSAGAVYEATRAYFKSERSGPRGPGH